jgi:hypothetical protein
MLPAALCVVACIDTTLQEAATEIAVNPDFVDLGTVAVGDTTSGLVRVDSVGRGLVHVVSVTLESAAPAGTFAVVGEFESVDLAKGESLSVPVQYTPSAEGWHEADLTIQSDADSGEAAVVVHVRAHAAVPTLVVSPSSLDFGEVAPGADVYADVTVQSASPVTANLLSAEVSGDSTFYLLSTTFPLSVVSGASVALSVAFGPTDELPQSAVLNLLTDDPVLGTVSIPIVANQCAGLSATDADGDGISECAGDCDDTRVDVYPGAEELLDDLDNDCDGRVDEGTDAYDDDGDGYSENDGDCNDNDSGIWPGNTETADGVDEDCDGLVDEGTSAYDNDGDGFTEAGGDCDDGDARVHPGADQRANGKDDDCDGLIDEETSADDADGDGYSASSGDCNDADPTMYPGAVETADGTDEDCDGTVDEGTDAYDDDGDGYTEDGGDCDDTDPDIGPHMLEVVGDGVDNDCDGIAQ